MNKSREEKVSATLLQDFENVANYGKETFEEIQKCLRLLVSQLDVLKTYPLIDEDILHVYRHDEVSALLRVPRVYFTFEDLTDFEPMNIDSFNRVISQMTRMSMDYYRQEQNKEIISGTGLDIEGWNIDMISTLYNGKRYPVKFCVYYTDFDNEHNDVENEYGIEQVLEIISDTW